MPWHIGCGAAPLTIRCAKAFPDAADVEKRAVSVPVEMGDQMCVNLCHHIAFSKGKAFVARIHIDAEGEQNGAENGADDREGRV